MKAIKKLKYITGIIFAFLIFTVAYAGTYPVLRQAELSYNQKTASASLSFAIQNLTNVEPQDYSAELRLISNGREIKRVPINWREKMKVKSDTAFVTEELSGLTLPNGVYETVLILQKTGMGIISLLKLNDIKIDQNDNNSKILDISCELFDITDNLIPVKCVANSELNQDAEVVFSVFPMGSSEPLLKKTAGDLYTDGKSFGFAIPLEFKYAGPIDIEISASEGISQSNTVLLRYNLPGLYANLLSVDLDKLSNVIDIYLNGSLYAENRRMVAGLFDIDGSCFAEDMDLKEIAPLHRQISYEEAKDCGNTATPFAVIYNYTGKDFEVGDIYDYKGLPNKGTAIAIINKYTQGQVNNAGNLINNRVIYYTLLIFALVSILSLLVLIKKRHVTGVIILTLALTGNVFAIGYINIGEANPSVFSLDAPNAGFIVNFVTLDNSVGKNDNIVFDLTAFDNTNASLIKYPGTEVFVKIDNGAEQKVMSANDPVTVTASLNNNLALGRHTLTFRATEACGSAFDYTRFANAEFGVKDCVFTTPFEVVANGNSYVTLTANPAEVIKGESSTLAWYLSSDIASCNASGDWSGAKSTNAVNYESTGALNEYPKTYSYNLTCKTTSGQTLTDNATVRTKLTEDPNTSRTLKIQANPSLIKSGSYTEIIWSSNGYRSCSVSENNPDINDSWRGLAARKNSSRIESNTTYTLTCRAPGGIRDTAQVEVKIAPRWVEI